MTLPDRNNPYSFDEFLKWRDNFDYYADDPFLQKVVQYFTGDQWQSIDAEARKISPKVSYRWRDMAEIIAQPQKHPFMQHFDGHNHRIDRIVRPHEIEVMEKEVFGERLFSDKTPAWLRLLKMYLIYQNSEACTSCPVTCTEGLIMLLEQFADSFETRQILQHCKEGIDGDVAIGAQYLSEIQGGSDVPANLVEAVKEGNQWRLYGKKFFCSATHADYAVVTAKPTGSEKVAVFVVPSWMPGNKEKEIRNGVTIDRIKWKMGTSELTTAELTYQGAIAYPLGPLDRGVANVTAIVLTASRLTVGLSGAAGMARSVREAKKYSELREAFGLNLSRFPMVTGQIRRLEHAAQRSTAAAFKVYREFQGLQGGIQKGLDADEPIATKRARFIVRELVMLQKITVSWDATDICRAAMSIFGGHGVMEDFSFLPRLYRDSAINELWEGPRNVLLSQIHRDLQRVRDWFPPAEFVQQILTGASDSLVDPFASEMKDLVENYNLLEMNEETIAACDRWDTLCHRLFHAYQDLALQEVEAGSN
ncbi:MAG: acyl-CoA dehydrogenase family protein [bacterium]